MARIDDLLEEIPDITLRAHLEREVTRLRKATRFGLMFERHWPETAILTGVDVVVGDMVRRRSEADTEETWRASAVNGDEVELASPDGGATEIAAAAELCVVRGFAEAVFPGLELVDEVRRSDDRPSHAVISGENYHALALMHFMWEGKVDCIYIDPPYNSGAADWKYNNRYVDSTDRWRHSKWLSFMERRLTLARRLLKPDGVLIVMIDENEVAHLGVLLEDIFPEYARHLVTIVINPKGTAKANFSRVEEHAYYVAPTVTSIGREVIGPCPRRRTHPRASLRTSSTPRRMTRTPSLRRATRPTTTARSRTRRRRPSSPTTTASSTCAAEARKAARAPTGRGSSTRSPSTRRR
jgi:adenine-specific DNA-methyltransferase